MKMKSAVFLDRDGVLNHPVVREGKPFPPSTLSEFELYPDAIAACQLLKAAGFLLVVATNQPDVGRGTQTREMVEAFHARLRQCLPLDRIEVCYDDGGGAPSEFRKPAPGMLLHAAQELGIHLASSYMVGDRWRDVDCGRAAGCCTIWIDRGYAEPLRQQPTFTATSLAEAARIILDHHEKQNMKAESGKSTDTVENCVHAKIGSATNSHHLLAEAKGRRLIFHFPIFRLAFPLPDFRLLAFSLLPPPLRG